MARHEFEATEGLLNDVMRKQAGSLQKAVLEAVMNSVDAGASEVTIDFDQDELHIIDDGEGMTRQEVQEYFKKFGLKDDDVEEKDFGKFRMGRGQIFSFGVNYWHSHNNYLIVNLNEDETTFTLGGEERTVDTEGLSYNLVEPESNEPGCWIKVELYNPIDDVEEMERNIKNLIRFIPYLHDIDVSINGEEFYYEPDSDHIEETEVAYHIFDVGGFGSSTHVYNQGAKVNDFDIVPVNSRIITKVDLDVNFARNDILNTDENWRGIVEEHEYLCEDYLIDSGEDPSNKESRWLLNRAAQYEETLMKIKSVPLIKDVTGELWSIEQLKGERVTFTRNNNKRAEDVMRQTGVVALDDKFEDTVSGLFASKRKVDYEDLVTEEMSFEYEHLPDGELSKGRKKRLEIVRWFLRSVGFDGDVRGGFSKTEDVWKDESGILYVDKGALNRNKDEFNTEILFKCVEIAAHDGSTLEGVQHDYSFERRYWRYMKNVPNSLRRVLSSDVPI